MDALTAIPPESRLTPPVGGSSHTDQFPTQKRAIVCWRPPGFRDRVARPGSVGPARAPASSPGAAPRPDSP